MKFFNKTIATVAALVLVNGGAFAMPASAAVQKVDFWISGACLDNYHQTDEYSLYEAYDDDCTLQVKVSPKSVSRLAYLQWWDSDNNKWTNEDSATTSKASGSVYLNIDPYCDSGWCDGTFTYRVYVPKKGAYASNQSREFDVVFYPDDGSY
jgi:hypothetical protein